MQLLIEIKGTGYQINAAFDDPECIRRILELAEAQEKANAGLLPPLGQNLNQVTHEAPIPVVMETLEIKHKKERKKVDAAAKEAVEKPVEAAPVPEPPPAPPAPPEAVQAAPVAANGAVDPEAFYKVAQDACLAAVGRNRNGVHALLKEFGVERFREMKDDIAKVQRFYARVVTV